MSFFDFLPKIFYNTLREELPQRNTIEDYLDYILPKVKRFSEELHEIEFYVEKQWTEVDDDELKTEKMVHIFKPELEPGEIKVKDEDQGSPYLLSNDGKIEKGNWSYIRSGGFIIKVSQRYQLYDLAFLSDDFFVLKEKRSKDAGSKYLFLVNEKLADKHDWWELMELLFDIYRYNLAYLIMWLGAIGIIVAVGLASLR
jgi:hypothetical protein